MTDAPWEYQWVSMIVLLGHLSVQLDLSEGWCLCCAHARERGHMCQRHDSVIWISRASVQHNLVWPHTQHKEVRETFTHGVAYPFKIKCQPILCQYGVCMRVSRCVQNQIQRTGNTQNSNTQKHARNVNLRALPDLLNQKVWDGRVPESSAWCALQVVTHPQVEGDSPVF